MTNIQAINLLKNLEQCLDDYCELSNEGKTAFRMAITALELFGNAEQLPSAQPVIRTYMSSANDTISRQAAVNSVAKGLKGVFVEYQDVAEKLLNNVPSVQPERMTNRQWIDFLSAQFDISRTSAKEMLHGMMRWKKEDNFKKMFNGGKT